MLSSSQYAYVEAFLSQNQESWIAAHVNSYRFFGGVTRMLVPDNLAISLLSKASNLAPEHAGVLSLRQVISEKWGAQGQLLLRAAARSLEDWSLMLAKQELDRASVLMPDSEQVAFLRERLSAKEQEVRLFGDKPAPTGEVVPAVVKYLSSIYPTETIKWHGSRSVLHDHRGTIYWLVQVSYALGTSPGEVRDEVAYIYQGEVAFMRDLHTGKLLWRRLRPSL